MLLVGRIAQGRLNFVNGKQSKGEERTKAMYIVEMTGRAGIPNESWFEVLRSICLKLGSSMTLVLQIQTLLKGLIPGICSP